MGRNEGGIEEIELDIVEEKVFGLMNEPSDAPGLIVKRKVNEWDELGDASVEMLEVDEATDDSLKGDEEEQRIVQL